MILPERVFGMSGTSQTRRGRAMGLISLTTASETRFSNSLVASVPGLSAT